MAGGYTGKYCIIDLSSKTTEVVEPDEMFYQKFLGGYGFGAAVITERQKAGVDPLSPQAYLGFGDILADGVKRAAHKIGNGAEKSAMHAGGQELPMHDSRLDPADPVDPVYLRV